MALINRPHRHFSIKTEIFVLLAEGLSTKQIADKLFLSEGTVMNYVSTINR